MRDHRIIAAGLFVVGLALVGGCWLYSASSLASVGGAAIALGFVFASGAVETKGLDSIEAMGFKFNLRTAHPGEPQLVPRDLSPEVRAEREALASTLDVPGAEAPAFNLLADMRDLRAAPGADPLVPMYLLDRDFRILDWNSAFSLAFDRTMEGRRGISVLEWTYFLDNYEEVLAHGVAKFSNAEKVPRIDVEEIHYTSNVYHRIHATKRAYQLPDDNEECVGWLVILELRFEEPEMEARYRLDLLNLLEDDLTWSEYALCYDRVLTASKTYRKLLLDIAGQPGGELNVLNPLRPGARVLDLGAGTGNLTVRLADVAYGRLVVALENNRPMLASLRSKCRRMLRDDAAGPGVFAAKQDITSLFGIQSGYFDYVVMNNVLYSLANPAACLRDCVRVLKPGGEIRLTGPKKTTNIERLFRTLRKDLEQAGVFAELQYAFGRVLKINQLRLADMPGFRWQLSEVEAMLRLAGFSQIVHSTDRAYAGEGMLVCARK